MVTNQPILVKSDFSGTISIPESFKYDEVLKPKILEAQQYDLKPALGKDFYAEIAATIDNSNNIPSGFTGFTQGNYDLLKPYLIDFVKFSSLARYYQDPNNKLTRFGVVQKKTPHSEPSNNEQRKESKRYYQGLSEGALNDLCEYLDDNSEKFNSWGNDPVVNEGQGLGFSSI